MAGGGGSGCCCSIWEEGAVAAERGLRGGCGRRCRQRGKALLRIAAAATSVLTGRGQQSKLGKDLLLQVFFIQEVWVLMMMVMIMYFLLLLLLLLLSLQQLVLERLNLMKSLLLLLLLLVENQLMVLLQLEVCEGRVAAAATTATAAAFTPSRDRSFPHATRSAVHKMLLLLLHQCLVVL